MTFSRVLGSWNVPTGMADFQVLPPGLSNVSYKGTPLDPNSMQLTGSSPLHLDSVCKDFFFTPPAMLDGNYLSRGIPSFLPPSTFAKQDRPSNFA